MHCHPGFCKICGAATHEIVKQHPIGSPLAGRPLKIGKALAGIVKAHFLLTNGTWATMTVHRACADNVTPDTLPQIWQNCLATLRFEEDNRALIGAGQLNKKQKLAVERYMAKLASEALLGLCCIEEL